MNDFAMLIYGRSIKIFETKTICLDVKFSEKLLGSQRFHFVNVLEKVLEL